MTRSDFDDLDAEDAGEPGAGRLAHRARGGANQPADRPVQDLGTVLGDDSDGEVTFLELRLLAPGPDLVDEFVRPGADAERCERRGPVPRRRAGG